jgi:hypothetical protein
VQAGFDQRPGRGVDPDELAAAVSRVIKPSGVVVLYACSTASLHPLGFASSLASRLPAGVRLLAHTTLGHATRNPYVRVYGAGEDGAWLFAPTSTLWHGWVHELHRQGSNMDAIYPFMSRDEIAARF